MRAGIWLNGVAVRTITPTKKSNSIKITARTDPTDVTKGAVTSQPMTPPACPIASSPLVGLGEPAATARSPRNDTRTAPQPTHSRPVSDNWSGCRMKRHASHNSATGSTQWARPNRPCVSKATAPATGPSAENQDTVATTMAPRTAARPQPSCSRAYSTSSSRPNERTMRPSMWATASQVARSPRPMPANARPSSDGSGGAAGFRALLADPEAEEAFLGREEAEDRVAMGRL